MNNKIVYGITSPRRHGKDTFAGLLTKYIPKLQSWAFADALKQDLATLFFEQFGVDIFTMDGEVKEKMRPFLIFYGCFWREFDIDHWVKKVINSIEASEEKYHIIKDVRFPSEIKFLKEKYGRNFILIEINREGGPEPTDEEKKNIPLIKPLVDYTINWPTVLPDRKIEELSPFVVDFYSKFFKD
jgi:hypothetical protein